MHILSVLFSLLFTSCSFAGAPEGYLDSQVGLDDSPFASFSSPGDVGMSGNFDELAKGNQRSYLSNNADPEPFFISSEDSDCSPNKGNLIPNSKRRNKRQSSDMCRFDSFVRSGPGNKPKTSPSITGQEGKTEQPVIQPDSKAGPVTQPMQDRSKCDDEVMNIPVCGSVRNVLFTRAVGPWTLLKCQLYNPLLGCFLPEILWCCGSVIPTTIQLLAGEISWQGSRCVSQDLVPKYRNQRLQLEQTDTTRPF